MSPTTTELIDLDLEDFRRLGVRPYECRLRVIRQAAVRSAKALAERQLRAPSEQVALQLSRVATSAYRLLDPRQRDDSNQRAYVGRILPSVLDGAAQTDFHDGTQRRAPDRDTPFISDRMSDAQLIELLELDAAPVSAGIQWTSSLSDEDLLSTTAFSRRLARIRPRAGRLWIVALLGTAMIALAAVVFHLRQEPAVEVVRKIDSTVLPTTGDTVPDLAVVAPAIDAMDRPADLLVEPSPIASLVPLDASETALVAPESVAPESVAPEIDTTEIDTPDLDAIETTLPDREMSGELDGEFLADPFAALSEELSPDSDAPMTSALELTPQKTDVSPTLPAAADPDDSRAQRVSQFDPPSSAAVKKARTEITMLIPELAEQILATEAEQRISQLETLRGTLEVGTADHWTVNLMIAQAAWLTEDGDSVRDRVKGWITDYRTTMDLPLASSFVRAIDLVATDETRQHLLKEGLMLADQLLVNESIPLCDDVVAAGGRLAKTLGDTESTVLLDQFADAITQMRRQADSTERLIAQAGGPEEGGPNAEAVVELSGDAGIAGRYYCLMLRRWEIGLPWLARTADLRVANIAAQEVGLGPLASADDLVELGERWLACAGRETGRTADSMKLHAIDLLERAKESLTGLRMLSLERQIDEVKTQLPFYLVQLTRGVEDGPSPDLSADEPIAPADMDSEGRSSLVGRMVVQGRDLGVQLDYGLGVAIRKERLDQVAQQLGESLDRVTVDLSGEIRLQNPTSISLIAANNVTGQRIWIDADLVTPKSGESTSTVDLEAGSYQVRWAFTPGEGESAFLRVQDSEGRDVPVCPTDTSGSVPIRTVLMVKVR
jgi:hypothetical protein